MRVIRGCEIAESMLKVGHCVWHRWEGGKVRFLEWTRTPVGMFAYSFGVSVIALKVAHALAASKILPFEIPLLVFHSGMNVTVARLLGRVDRSVFALFN